MSRPWSTPRPLPVPVLPRPEWPDGIRRMAIEVRKGLDAPGAAHARAELWVLLHAALTLCVRIRARRAGSVPPEDAHDLVAQKTLELMTQIDSGAWDPAASEAEQIRSFVFSVAGHGVVDLTRARRAEPEGVEIQTRAPFVVPSQESWLDSAIYAGAIRECLARLTPRARAIWYMRVLLEMPSREVARHPQVGMTRAGVDVTLFRARAAVRSCLRTRSLDWSRVPEGTFAQLWDLLESGA